jgi:uncharacterized heparinase superfamily protein
LSQQVSSEGYHISYRPESHVFILRDLIDIRAALHHAQLPLPKHVQDTIEKVASVIRRLTHGFLTRFLSHNEQPKSLIRTILSHANISKRRKEPYSDVGFEQFNSGKSLVLINVHDIGMPFDLSVGNERLILGGHVQYSQKFLKMIQRKFKPFSEFLSEHSDGGTWWNIKQSFNSNRGALDHYRQMYITKEGEDISGADNLMVTSAGMAEKLYFPLHPTVRKIAYSQDHTSVFFPHQKGMFGDCKPQDQLIFSSKVILILMRCITVFCEKNCIDVSHWRSVIL